MPRKRPLLIGLAIVAVAIVLAVWTTRSLRGAVRSPGAAAMAAVDAAIVTVPVVPTRAAVAEVVLTEVRGRVERKRDGAWQVVARGAVLDADDQIRTADDSEATLAIASVGTVVLAPRSDFEVGRRTQELMSLQLGRGRLSADVQPGAGLPLRIAIRGSDAIAESLDGRFSVLSAGSGTVAVATERGSVDVTAVATTIHVAQGELSVIEAGGPPSSPRAIPASLILKLARAPRLVASREVTITGRTTPGAIVTVTGARVTIVTADPVGTFAARVILAEGHNRVLVAALDPVGRRASDNVPVIVDTRPPDVEAEVRWGTR